MSRIDYSDNYYGHGKWCPARLHECNRHYCNKHRLLWRDCDTVKTGWEGDSDVVNGMREIFELGDCPRCEREARQRRNAEEIARREAEMRRAPL